MSKSVPVNDTFKKPPLLQCQTHVTRCQMDHALVSRLSLIRRVASGTRGRPRGRFAGKKAGEEDYPLLYDFRCRPTTTGGGKKFQCRVGVSRSPGPCKSERAGSSSRPIIGSLINGSEPRGAPNGRPLPRAWGARGEPRERWNRREPAGTSGVLAIARPGRGRCLAAAFMCRGVSMDGECDWQE